MAIILNRTSLAAISFGDGTNTHIPVYYHDTERNIRETLYDTGSNPPWHQNTEATVGKGKLDSGIAAVSWSGGTQVQIRVYCLSSEGYIVEVTTPVQLIVILDSSSQTLLTGAYFTAVPNSELAATQSEAISGTGISAALTATILPRVYFQVSGAKFVEWVSDSQGNWTQSSFTCQGTYVNDSCTAALGSGTTNIWVFATNDQNRITQTEYTNPGAGRRLSNSQPPTPCSPILLSH
ncbi:uncharacterized protein F4822DRAFT_433273 [Hypoxylon trugodes]|uniref:uncharacterized protein n=1 Tax=Hypoxylon trugodes TaxID=326681 RepID=UPI002190F705|nr:uncharacterized protein F4822DRAFT_433273 [Hypoxylon trugodes]KAI1384732.1 hypothetical protein F4822DRAFT_433273 [Hypoxylon trugodes]